MSLYTIYLSFCFIYFCYVVSFYTIFNLFFTLSLCNVYFYFVIRYYHIVFDIFKMLSLFLLCVFILSYLSITTYCYLTNTSPATNIITMLCLCSCTLVFKMIILQPLAPKAKNFYFYYDVNGTCVTMPSRLCDMFYGAYIR